MGFIIIGVIVYVVSDILFSILSDWLSGKKK